MKCLLSVTTCIISAISICHAQAPCDSIYAAEDKFRENKIGLMLFDVPPKVTLGAASLDNYTSNKDKIGIVTYRILINEVGNASCIKFAGTTNKILLDEANSIVELLRFKPALLRGKGIKSTMYVTVRFYEDKPRKRNGRNSR